MNRKLTLLATLILLFSLLVGCCSTNDTEVLNKQLEEAQITIEALTTQIEAAKSLISELENAANNSALVYQKIDGVIRISSVLHDESCCDIPFYATANEAKKNPCFIGRIDVLGTVASFQVEGLESATDVVITVISEDGHLLKSNTQVTDDGVYVFSREFYQRMYTVEISYSINEVQNAIYFAPVFD